jgi:site-specific DNA-methyltransferase (adenine-specific)
MSYLINTYSNPGETVLDNVMGSGTTGVAAVMAGRNFIGIEKNEEYYVMAEQRINEVRKSEGLQRTV